jgi:hypothetical protein
MDSHLADVDGDHFSSVFVVAAEDLEGDVGRAGDIDREVATRALHGVGHAVCSELG